MPINSEKKGIKTVVAAIPAPKYDALNKVPTYKPRSPLVWKISAAVEMCSAIPFGLIP